MTPTQGTYAHASVIRGPGDAFPACRVQAHAAAALVNFCNDVQADTLELYLGQLMPALFKCLSSPRLDVQEQVISTIATVAEVAKEKFVPVRLHPHILLCACACLTSLNV